MSVRSEVVALTVATTVIVLSPVPDVGANVNQVAPFLVVDQLVLDVMENVFSSIDDVKFNDDRDTDTDNTKSAAACVIAMSWVFPPPETVTLAVRGDTLVLAVAVNVIVLLPVPVELDTVNQVAPFLVIVQSMLDVMENVFCSAIEVKLIEDVDTDKETSPAACTTLMVSCGIPIPVTEMVAVCCAVSLLVAAETVTFPFPEPDDGEIVSHEVLLEAFHDFVFVSIEKDCSPPVFKKFIELVDSDSVIGTSVTVSRHPLFTNPSKSKTPITFDTLTNDFQFIDMSFKVFKKRCKGTCKK